jgi:hypothetical protein
MSPEPYRSSYRAFANRAWFAGISTASANLAFSIRKTRFVFSQNVFRDLAHRRVVSVAMEGLKSMLSKFVLECVRRRFLVPTFGREEILPFKLVWEAADEAVNKR